LNGCRDRGQAAARAEELDRATPKRAESGAVTDTNDNQNAHGSLQYEARVSDPRIAEVQRHIRDIPNFPKPGILFKDITPLLSDAAAFRLVTDLFEERLVREKPDLIVGIESRGFIFGAPLALRLGVGFVPVRKPGKLPYKTRKVTYDTEYSTDTLEMHEDAIAKGKRVVIVDDLLATGGTAGATARLVEEQGGVVTRLAFVVELDFLSGRGRLGGREVESLLHY
jgi:adenine phosphoribosyltransferase